MTGQPSAGVCVLVWRDGQVLFIERGGSHGHGTWGVPGGHLEFGESWEECVRREAMEELGVEIKNVRFLAATNDIFPDHNKHYVSIWMEADWAANEPESKEPEKITNVAWHTLTNLPSPLFEPCWANIKKLKPELFD